MQLSELDSKRIAVLLSGGVDSSVVVYEFAKLGLHPDCFYIKIGPEDDKEWDCSSEEDLEMATAVAHKYGCNLEVIDCHREYWDQVTRYTMEKVRAGFTPNPDVMCNRLIKFGAFDEKRGHDYDLIATGHYAQTEIDEAGRKWLVTSPDPVKDQTDFLAQIYDWQLRKAIFPIGHYVKDEVRQIAEREHLVNAKRKDSQGICFLGKINYNDYIRRYLGENPGDVIELETSGGPWFVVKKDVPHNILYVSHGYNPATAYKTDFPIHDIHWLTVAVVRQAHQPITVPEPAALSTVPEPVEGLSTDITFKIRHTPEYIPGTLEQTSPDTYIIHSKTPIHGVAPGQFCVIYDQAHHRCLGSAEITL